MAEFGENLKRIREEKGITQQTLADYLYVTRQAVSRWEGGSRYPDIMTAKKMSQYLGVTLDELLSDDDMHLYVEKNAILDSSISKRLQTILISLAFMCSLILSIVYLCNHFIPNTYILESKSETFKNILLTLILGYGIYASVTDKLNQKIATFIYTLYFGTATLTGILFIIIESSPTLNIYLVGCTLLNIIITVTSINYFQNKKHVNPLSIYITTIIYGITSIITFIYGFTLKTPIEIYRDTIILNIFAFIQILLLLTLLTLMTHTLNTKRKLSNK